MEPTEARDHLRQSLEWVRERLERNRLVENMVHAQDTHNREVVESLVHRQHLVDIQTHINRLHIADVAYILEALPLHDRELVWQQLPPARAGDVLLEVSDAVRENLIKATAPGQLEEILKRLDTDDLAYIAEDVPEDLLQQRLRSLTEEDQTWLQSSLSYPEGTVGDLMISEMMTVREVDTLEQVQQRLRRLKALPAHTDKLFVLDTRGVFRGVVHLHTLLLNDPEDAMRELMVTEVVRFAPLDKAGDAAAAFERYDLVSAPVLNERGKLVGRLTVDSVVDYIREEASDDVLNMAGLHEEEDLFAPLWQSARNRGTWLLVNVGTAFIASRVIGIFEASIMQLVALAALMPIIASVGGNTGNQTTALVIRGMALGQIDKRSTRHLLRKELSIGLVNGALLGVVVGLFAYVIYTDLHLALVMTGAMLLTLVLAAGIGMAVPLLLQAFGRDPALGSSVLITAATDSLGFAIFLGMATVFLL